MLSEGTAPEAVTQQDALRISEAVNKYRTESGKSLNYIARAISWAPSSLSQFLKSKYAGDWQQLALDLDRWLDDQLKHEATAERPAFIWTEVAKEILTIADAASRMRSIGLVYGKDSSGIGKTMALQAIHAEKPGSILVTAQKAAASPTAFFRAVAAQIEDIPTLCSHNETFRLICGKLKDTPRLLIIDQVHSLCDSPDDKVFFELMDLYDHTHAPQLWCGTSDIFQYFNRRIDKGRETLAQIRRRIRPKRDLMLRMSGDGSGGRGEPLVSVQKVREMFAKNRIRLSSDAVNYLMRILTIPDSGAVATCVDLVQMATILGEAPGANVTLLTAAHLRSAQTFLLQPEAVRLLDAQMEEEASRPIAKLA